MPRNATAAADTPHPEMKPDLTLLIDITERWPDPTDAPDVPERHPTGPLTLAEAKASLERLRVRLNGEAATREPTKKEQADILARLERGSLTDRQTLMGVEKAARLRAYVRKLEARAEAAAQRDAEAKRRRLEQRAGSFDEVVAQVDEQRHALRDGYERYRQWLADRDCYYAAVELRPRLDAAHREASHAARELGREAPVLPEWADELPEGRP